MKMPTCKECGGTGWLGIRWNSEKEEYEHIECTYCCGSKTKSERPEIKDQIYNIGEIKIVPCGLDSNKQVVAADIVTSDGDLYCVHKSHPMWEFVKWLATKSKQ